MRVPGHIVDNKGQPFPQGTFLGRLAEVKDSWSEDGKSAEYILTFRDNSPVDGPNVGARPFTQRIQVVYQDQSIVDITEFGERTPFSLQRAAGLVAQLAVALGYATRSLDGSVEFNTEELLENLLTGAYKDRQLGYEVKHRNWKSKTQKDAAGKPTTGTSAEIVRFFNPEASESPVLAEVTGGNGTPQGTLVPAAEIAAAAQTSTLREVRARA
jgi:hypothetical protein